MGKVTRSKTIEEENAARVCLGDTIRIAVLIQRRGPSAPARLIIDRSRQNLTRGTTGPRDADGGWLSLIRGDRC